MRANEESQVAHEHGSAELVAGSTPDQSHGVGIVLDMRVLDSYLADDIAGVDGDQANPDCQDDSCDHPEVCEGGWDAGVD